MAAPSLFRGGSIVPALLIRWVSGAPASAADPKTYEIKYFTASGNLNADPMRGGRLMRPPTPMSRIRRRRRRNHIHLQLRIDCSIRRAQ
jgi:hypothetical protein